MAMIVGTAGHDIIDGTSAADELHGLAGDDRLTGGGENDVLLGGDGADMVSGGDGNDRLYDDDADFDADDGAVDRLDGGSGDDDVRLGANDIGEGGAGHDILSIDLFNLGVGTTIDLSAMWSGGGGINGTGSVTGFEALGYIYGSQAADTITLGTSGLVLDPHFGPSILGSGGDDRLTGGEDVDRLFGNEDNDTLFGLGAGDTLSGNAGNDRIEGGAGDDWIEGHAGDDWIEGGAGDDFMHGGWGVDTLIGGPGGDTYDYSWEGLPSDDHIVEQAADAGVDTLVLRLNGPVADAVFAGIRHFELAQVTAAGDWAGPELVLGAEFAASGIRTLTVAADVDASAVAAGLAFTVQPVNRDLAVSGGSGDDLFRFGPYDPEDHEDQLYVLSGGAGRDTLRLEASWDSSLLAHDPGQGTLLLSGFEAIELSGGGDPVAVPGGPDIEGFYRFYVIELADAMMNAGTSFTVDGSALRGDHITFLGVDREIGGTGINADALIPDRLVLDAQQLTGGRSLDVVAGGGDDDLTGGAAGDRLSAGGGADWVRGGGGADVILGGDGDDIIFSFAPASRAPGADHLAEGAYDPGVAADSLAGGGGSDMLHAGLGDSVDGGSGFDTLLISFTASTAGVTVDFRALPEAMVVAGATIVNVEAVVWLEGSNQGDSLRLGNADLDGAQLFGRGGHDAVYGHRGDDLIYGGAGNDDLHGAGGSDELTGDEGDDRLDGGAGADRMTGGAGDDVYVLDAGADRIVESAGAGTDTVEAGVTYRLGAEVENLVLTGAAAINGYGNISANELTGNDAANRLDGAGGADRMAGKSGDDIYVVDHGGDLVVETAAGGADTIESRVSYALPAYVEQLVLTGTAANGTGNSAANTMTGTMLANLLNGGAGADTLRGLGGDDLYIVDAAADAVVEMAEMGNDTVRSSANFTLPDHVEALVLTGGGDTRGAGNGLANAITGNNGNNRLDGKAGADTMAGGQGHDVYVVNNPGDQVVEAGSSGNDTVESGISFTLPVHFENLVLTGTFGLGGRGNAGANRITGNAGANFLSGGSGNDVIDGGAGNDRILGGNGSDTLKGGAGADRFEFLTAPGAGNVDRILDFSAADDSLYLLRAAFSQIGPAGTLSASAFRAGAAAADADDRILYDAATGKIFYDADGSGALAAVHFATVGAGTALTHADFMIYG